MGFILFIAVIGVIWLLWNISENTGASLDKQTAIQYEIVALEKRLEELSSRLEKVLVSSAQPVAATQQNVATVNLNTASLKQLQSLAGVGPALAKRIVEGRVYNSVGDLAKVEGISSDLLEKLTPFISVV
ncbi:MAG: helix-hairpin-helix domain-containing protein [Hahellaceae bacterium]|nr:helix-hairpin-helix domain-containing protein [Hahellaceae bacterium]MCP5169313.1 helix-hairpin-helix domain-containing protein [Hahellaceae bacterium]